MSSAESLRRLPASFYGRDALSVARDLLGKVLCRRLPDGTVLRGRLVEVEAYDGFNDRASHAYRGRTERNRWMFEDGGLAYVYFVYGMHHCVNVVTGVAGTPSAVLLRAAESPRPGVSASGPGRLTKAFRIDRTLDGSSFLTGPLWLEDAPRVPDAKVRRTRRIGVDYAGTHASKRYRFVLKGHPDVSGPKAMR
ncbi:MAG TPA: DNA-3-methyladenine glycosylase [Candidatus Polarisedimenticolaceae bacterium]|nr:DNA-3-methyladenine glycosylase [Candidatus Polarisedimenticolaceae bacterium]